MDEKAGPLKITVRYTWVPYHEQGREPYTSETTIYAASPITKREIDATVNRECMMSRNIDVISIEIIRR